MILVLALVVASSDVGGVATPTDDRTVAARFLEGDLVTLRRAQVLRRRRGERVDLGRLGLLEDLSRLVRCLPIGPIPPDERAPYRLPRALARLERIRLERLVRDRAHRGTALAKLVTSERRYRTRGADDPAIVRWPIEDELWPGEVPDPTLTPSRCPSSPGALKERPEKTHRAQQRLRLGAERAAVAALLPDLEQLPDLTAARVALTYLVDAQAAEGFVVDAEWRRILEAVLARAPAPYRAPGRLLLALVAERSDRAEALRLYHALLADPTCSAAEDSRARVRLVFLLEPDDEASAPDWSRILEVARDAKAPRPADEMVLANAHARALFALGETEALMTLGRKIIQREDRSGPFFAQTNELLTLLALDLEPARAIAWLDEIALADESARAERLEELAELARERGRFDLAVALYDRRRAEVRAGIERRGPRAAAKDAELVARRAFLEYERDDIEAFAGFVDELVQLARDERGRPIARYAPHKAVARLSQDLLGRLTDDVKEDRQREKFAAVLLEAAAELSRGQTRYRRVLERFLLDLERLAGRYAVGRTRVAAPDAKKRSRTKTKPVKQLGEVIVSRLPPKLAAPDEPTPAPFVPTFVMYERPDGTWVEDAPWRLP